MRKPNWVRNAERREHAKNLKYDRWEIIRRCHAGDLTDFHKIYFLRTDVVLRLIEEALLVDRDEASRLLNNWMVASPMITTCDLYHDRLPGGVLAKGTRVKILRISGEKALVEVPGSYPEVIALDHLRLA